MQSNLKEKFLKATLEELTDLAGEDIATWSRWLAGMRDLRISSLYEPARRMAISPGELLDLILERRRQHLSAQIKDLESQIAVFSEQRN